jgi:cytidyltransferase-like protein
MNPSVGTRLPRASVHGRFQPFHNGHLEYIEAALARCDFLYVGITQYVIHKLVQVPTASAVHRGQPDSNPLTYHERLLVIDAIMSMLNVTRERYVVLPFPIEEAAELPEFLPTSVPIFTTTYDEWNEQKIETLEACGYEVLNLWTRPKKLVVGQQIRESIRNGSSAWRQDVPSATARLLDEFDIAGRLRGLAPGDGHDD